MWFCLWVLGTRVSLDLVYKHSSCIVKFSTYKIIKVVYIDCLFIYKKGCYRYD
jgi:hypothetical protein